MKNSLLIINGVCFTNNPLSKFDDVVQRAYFRITGKNAPKQKEEFNYRLLPPPNTLLGTSHFDGFAVGY